MELGASIGTVGLVIGLYSITNTPANILFGRLIDRIGYRLPLVGGLLGSALSMFLYTVSRFPIHLAMVRVIHGITGAPIGPATMSVFADYGSETRKGRAMGLYGMALASATLVGYGVGRGTGRSTNRADVDFGNYGAGFTVGAGRFEAYLS